MSGTFPTYPVPTAVTVTSVQPTRVSVAQNLKRFTRATDVQRFRVRYEWAVLERADWAAIYAFMLSQRGQFDTFTLILPTLSTARGSFAGTPKVDGAHAAGVSSVAVKGLTPSQPNVARAGDLIKFNGHAKVYMVTADANSDSAGKTTLSVIPAFISALANDEVIVTSSVPMTVAALTDSHELKLRAPSLLGEYALDMMESV